MATNAATFNNALVDAVKTLSAEVNALETWAGNKVDSNPNFDFTTAQATLNSAVSSLLTSVGTINAL